MSRVPPRLFELKRLNKSQSRFPETRNECRGYAKRYPIR